MEQSMIEKLIQWFNRNSCKGCDCYCAKNNVCQSKKCVTCGCHPYVNWFDRHFCQSKTESESIEEEHDSFKIGQLVFGRDDIDKREFIAFYNGYYGGLHYITSYKDCVGKQNNGIPFGYGRALNQIKKYTPL